MERQTWVALQNASLFYSTLYIDFAGGSTDAVARHVSFAQITCCSNCSRLANAKIMLLTDLCRFYIHLFLTNLQSVYLTTIFY